jgi:hypothetical protein
MKPRPNGGQAGASGSGWGNLGDGREYHHLPNDRVVKGKKPPSEANGLNSPISLQIGWYPNGLDSSDKKEAPVPGSTGALLCLLFTLTGSGGARELPAIEIPIRLFRSVDHYKYATQERKNGRGGQLVVIIKRLGAD